MKKETLFVFRDVAGPDQAPSPSCALPIHDFDEGSEGSLMTVHPLR